LQQQSVRGLLILLWQASSLELVSLRKWDDIIDRQQDTFLLVIHNWFAKA